MYVRWQRHGLKKQQWDCPCYLVEGEKPKKLREDAKSMAVLVESFRANGKSRQRYIAYLGSIADSAPLVGRIKFWNAVTDRLDQLTERVSPDDRSKIEGALSARVPRPTEAERKPGATALSHAQR
jgi:hypothetical protein